MKAEKLIYSMNDIRDEYVTEYAEKAKSVKTKALHHFRTWGIIAACLALVIICVPVILQKNNTPSNHEGSEGTSKSIEQQPDGAMAFNEGVTISPALNELLKNADQDAVFSVRIEILNLTEVYENEYSSELYDGKTYESWWQEYESINARMLEIEGKLKDGPDVALEAEYNECVEKSEEINLYLSEIMKKQKSSSIQKEIEYFKTLGIETVYKGGFLTAELSTKQIQSISKGRCDYLIDIPGDKEPTGDKEPIEDIH